LTSGLIEGFNNLIARMIHKACGYRDLDYLELKLRHRSVMRRDEEPKKRRAHPATRGDHPDRQGRSKIPAFRPRTRRAGRAGTAGRAGAADHLGPELLWTGAFLDGSAKWLDRGTANNPPAGENLVSFASETPAIPNAKFKGYKLDSAGNPTFIVQISGRFLLDAWRAEAGSLIRTFTLQGKGQSLILPLGASPQFPELPSEATLIPDKPVTLTYRWNQ
jgi:hypothetical protein